MLNKRNYFLLFAGSLFLLFSASNSLANFSDINADVFNPQSFKSSGDYQIAGIKFLPETYDDLGYSGRTYDNENTAPTPANNCNNYKLSECPDNAICSKCPWDSKYKTMTGCQKNYIQSGSTCKAKTCKEINSVYLDAVPANNSCTSVTEGDKTCYKDCKDCSSYALSGCPTNANCSQCGDNFKIDSCQNGLTVYPESGCYPANCNDYPISYNSVGGNYSNLCKTYQTCWIPGMMKDVAKCTDCNAGHKLQNNTCVASEASIVGSILYSDLTTSRDVISGKTPIGVVFDPSKKLAIGFRFKNDHWSIQDGYFGTPSFKDTYGGEYRGQTDTQGRQNTTTLIANGGNKVTAAYYCTKYTTSGTRSGNWFLPSGSQIMSIYNNRSTINDTLKKLGQTNLTTSFWSSTSCSEDGAFHLYNGVKGCGQTGNGGKTDGTRSIIPVIDYGDVTTTPNIKFVINISKTCPTGMTFAGTYGYTDASGKHVSAYFACNDDCYEKGGFNGMYSNMTESIVPEGTSISLTGLDSRFKSIKSAVSGHEASVEGGYVYYTTNKAADITSKYDSLYDYWTLQCGSAPSEYEVTLIARMSGPNASRFNLTQNGITPFSSVTIYEPSNGYKSSTVLLYPDRQTATGPHVKSTTTCSSDYCSFSFKVPAGAFITTNTHGSSDIYDACGYPKLNDMDGNDLTQAEDMSVTPTKNNTYHFNFSCMS